MAINLILQGFGLAPDRVVSQGFSGAGGGGPSGAIGNSANPSGAIGNGLNASGAQGNG